MTFKETLGQGAIRSNDSMNENSRSNQKPWSHEKNRYNYDFYLENVSTSCEELCGLR